MKKIFTLSLLFLALGAFGQIKVSEKNVNIDGGKNGYYIEIPFGDQKSIEKELKDEMKSWKGSFSEKKGVLFADDCKMKSMGDNTFDAYGTVEENPSGGVFVSVAIDLGGAFLNSKEHSAQYKVIEGQLQAWAVKASKSFVDGEIKEQEKVLEGRQKELSDLEGEQSKLEKEIEDYKKKIADNEKAIEESKKQQEEKKGEIKTQEGVVQEVMKKKEGIK